MTKLVIITRNDLGTASVFLKDYLDGRCIGSKNAFAVDLVVTVKRKRRKLKSKIKKINKIGLGGAVVGLYLRRFYKVYKFKKNYQSLKLVCEQNNIPYYEFSSYDDKVLIDLIASRSLDYGLSLGNDIMPKHLLSVPKYGFLNVHHELLPDFPNAQSIIWSIYHKRNYTGLTLHKMTSIVDEGKILRTKKIRMVKGDTLGDCILENYEDLVSRTYSLFENFINFGSNVSEEGYKVEKHTTPSLRHFMSIRRKWQEIDFDEN